MAKYGVAQCGVLGVWAAIRVWIDAFLERSPQGSSERLIRTVGEENNAKRPAGESERQHASGCRVGRRAEECARVQGLNLEAISCTFIKPRLDKSRARLLLSKLQRKRPRIEDRAGTSSPWTATAPFHADPYQSHHARPPLPWVQAFILNTFICFLQVQLRALYFAVGCRELSPP
jgi:hypothetical protein